MRPHALLSLLLDARKLLGISSVSNTIGCKVNFVRLSRDDTPFELAVVEQ